MPAESGKAGTLMVFQYNKEFRKIQNVFFRLQKKMTEFKTAVCDTTNQTDIFPEGQMINLNSIIRNERNPTG